MTKEGMRYRIFSDSDDDSFLKKIHVVLKNKYCTLAGSEFDSFHGIVLFQKFVHNTRDVNGF